MIRAAAFVLAVLGGIVALVLTSGWAVAPWSPACVVRDADGVVLAQGDPGEVGARVSAAIGAAAGLAAGPAAGAAAGPAAGADRALGAALVAGPAVTCRVEASPVPAQAKGARLGLTPRARSLRSEVRERFGPVPDGGFGPQETLPGRRPGGEHSSGRAIDFFFRPLDDPLMAEGGWALANWAVANADRLSIRTVIYRDRIWTARRSAQGWRDYRFRGPDPDNPVNRHLDHVHIDVA